MEGDGPTGGSMLFQYSTIIVMLSAIKQATPYPNLVTMVTLMIKLLQQYQREALNCDAIVLATILNPKFRVEIFKDKFPDYAKKAEDLIRSKYADLEASNQDAGTTMDKDTDPAEEIERDPFEETNIFGASNGPTVSFEEELDQYLLGKIPCTGDILDWWRVSKISPEFSFFA